jgi:hypothetical protein
MARVEVCIRDIFKKVNPCLDHEGRRRVKVGERFYVRLMICEGMVSDGMWVSLTHAALFADKKAAERLAEKVLAAVRKPAPGTWGGIDLKNWRWSHGKTNAFTALQEPSTATEYEVG